MLLAPPLIIPEAWMDLLAEQQGHSVTQRLASQLRFVHPFRLPVPAGSYRWLYIFVVPWRGHRQADVLVPEDFMQIDTDVVVIGAGVAGLVAAKTHSAGIPCVVVEASHRIMAAHTEQFVMAVGLTWLLLSKKQNSTL